MKKEVRTVCFDEELGLEAQHFEGFSQPFPNHFHDYYVIGFVEAGERRLSCRGREYTLTPGSIVLFNPGDNHACAQCDGGAFNYRGFHIPQETMRALAGEITGQPTLPGFARNVLHDSELACALQTLHRLVMAGSREFEKEETLLLVLSGLLERCGQPFERCVPDCPEEIERVCAYLRTHCAERVTLDGLCGLAGLSKSTLIRAFTRSKGVTPYRYLENLRIGAAKRLLEQGVPPVEAALRTGFSDQSHFTNYFTRFIGLPPGAYHEMFRKKAADGGDQHDA